MIEAVHYRIMTIKREVEEKEKEEKKLGETGSRTAELIDSFLGTMPDEDRKNPKGRKPTPADAAVDYVAYLLESGAFEDDSQETPQMKGQVLIDEFISKEGGGRIILPKLEMETQDSGGSSAPIPDDLCTETMAQIYVRQGRYSQALEIIKRLNLDNPKKNAYFADQIRFLEKLIVNNNKTKNNK